MAKAVKVAKGNERQIISIDDQYIAKRKRQRIITNSIIISVCFILGIAIMLMACLKIDLKPKFDATPEFVYIKVDGKSNTIDLAKNDEEYYDFLNIYNNSLSTSVLTALFTGNVYGYTIERLGTGKGDSSAKFYQTYTNGVGTALSSSLQGYLGSNYVQLKFDEEQTLYYSNGDEVKGRYETNKEIYYKDVCFTISSDENSTTMDFYFGVIDYETFPTLIKITVEANTYDLYKFASDL